LHANVKRGPRIVKPARRAGNLNLFRERATNGYRNLLTLKERAMSRKLILSLAAVATLAGTALVSNNADAMVVHGGRGGGHPVFIGHRVSVNHPHVHWRHWARWHDHYIVGRVGLVTPVETAVQPGPCTCLTKNYTPEGMVVFQDLCTKEMASAPVAGTEQSSQIEAPASYAGQTYQDYLKTHPEAVQPETKKN
jgi:hypothetical protein